MLNIKLIACDIDGTLLDDNKNISSNMLNNEERTVEQDGFTIEVIPIWKWMIMLENK